MSKSAPTILDTVEMPREVAEQIVNDLVNAEVVAYVDGDGDQCRIGLGSPDDADEAWAVYHRIVDEPSETPDMDEPAAEEETVVEDLTREPVEEPA